ncbi:MAG: hypothetical protein MUE60_14765, partial [Candidatus Eisenbacteria bacterium]|nr:hypothetical protein [Candidatus Eisenbacteria bacterium]
MKQRGFAGLSRGAAHCSVRAHGLLHGLTTITPNGILAAYGVLEPENLLPSYSRKGGAMRLAVFAATLALALPATALDLAARTLDYGVTEWGVAGSYRHLGDTDAHYLELELRGGKMMGGGMELEMQGWLERRW